MPSTLPATPTSVDLHRTKNRRFEKNIAACEWAEEYRPGGYHPVNLGDVFGEQYRVIRKLGEGSFSTVWLAKDLLTSKYVALKIMVAKASSSSAHLPLLYRLAVARSTDPRSEYVTLPLNMFNHEGPNGKHLCCVFPAMGPSAASMIRDMPFSVDQLGTPSETHGPRRFPLWIAKRLARSALTGLAFLHDNNVIHGDVQPGNILFPVENIDFLSERDLGQNEDRPLSTHKLKRIDGLEDRWAPAKLFVRQELRDFVRLEPDFSAKLSDLGSAFFSDDPPKKVVTPVALRAPEVILGNTRVGKGIDIWAVGCLLYEFVTGQALFPLFALGAPRKLEDDLHLCQMHDILGPLPENIKSAWTRHDRWFGPNGEHIRPYGTPGSPRHTDPSLEDAFRQQKGDDVDDEDAKEICKLIRRMMQYNASDRPTAAELLKHPWFRE
ncbi:serine/threonine-protein kinase SRPK3 [Elsinoe ampelina]|uniref:Serine/threonine-protein kinase SRPK3 n=1 Tax=Elsinoe ampelina TaxID=302913 RepID=A0A6A6FZW3_9PEZI|nr:serine/threonine-protein kinase SRPK3 [Elsinoe ampelina]